MQKANYDITYCQSETCTNKCWRHYTNFEFEQGQNYWFQDKCNEEYAVITPKNEKHVPNIY